MSQIDLSQIPKEPLVKPSALPILATRNLVLFPGVSAPLMLVRDEARRLTQYAQENNIAIGVCCQLSQEGAVVTDISKVCSYGVMARVIQVMDLPDGSKTAFLLGGERFRIIGQAEGDCPIPFSELKAKVRTVRDILAKSDETSFGVQADVIHNKYKEFLQKGEGQMVASLNLEGMPTDPRDIVNFVATQLPIPPADKMEMLRTSRLVKRAFELTKQLLGLIHKLDIANSIKDKAREGLSEQSRNVFLREQMEAIRKELYGQDGSEETEALRKRADQTKFPPAVREIFDKELDKIKRQNPQSPDYSTSFSYLEELLELPWGIETPLNGDFTVAEQTLNADHFGLEKVKDRIMEQLAVMMNNPAGKSPIICLTGAPGVGKTSLGQSIARALGRNYQRVSLGGLHDEAEIRGHRRTYIGAMPGRIVEALKRAKSVNPVLLLDEVDKIGRDYKGDPDAALLEVLDPEQNCHFHDNYIDVDFDLSKVLFIATANTLSTVSQPLIDRMEVIEISGYLLEEKIEIARRHLIPRILKENNLTADDLTFSEEALRAIIDRYTVESGVRQLEKALAAVVRKVILRKMRNQNPPREILPEHLHDYLGMERHLPGRYEGNEFTGVVTGLAWTAAGGEILFIESSLAEGKGEKLALTGNLGDVMKESANIALQYVRAHARELGIDPEMFETRKLHIHVPEGAIPKDGPSAGITMATSIVSAFTGRKVRERTAMTGEITLRGKVLPVGGIKEKILAAKRAGITDIVLSEENRRDIDDIAPRYVAGLTFHYASTVMDVLAFALL